MRKIIALLLAVGLMLSVFSGCGDKSATEVSEEASVVAVSQEKETDSAVEAVQSLEEEGETPPEDPAQLGKWIWDKSVENQDSVYASDYDMEVSLTMVILEEEITESTRGRVRMIEGEDGLVYHSVENGSGSSVEKWYKDGMMYESSSLGDFKAPVEESEVEEMLGASEILSSEGMELDSDSFNTVVGEVTASGYQVTFSDVNLNTWMDFIEVISEVTEDADGMECTAFELDGVRVLNQEYDLVREEINLSMGVEYTGITVEITMHIASNGFDEAVSISVPEDDRSFVEYPDIEVPDIYVEGYNAMVNAMDYGMTYDDVLLVTLGADDSDLAYRQHDTISYTFDSDGLLQSQWDSILYTAGEVEYQSSDQYYNGVGQILEQPGDGVYDYTYDDFSMMSDILSFQTYYADSFDYGSNYVLGEDGEYTTLTYDVNQEYVELIGGLLLPSFGVDITEATEITTTGTMTIWFGQSGMVIRQKYQAHIDMMLPEGLPMSVVMTDDGSVTATGAGVQLGAVAY